MRHRDSKYHNSRVEVDGIRFDSKKEAKRYLELKALEDAGKITDLKRQVRFNLIPSQYEYIWSDKKGDYVKGKCLERQCDYVADFVYFDNETCEKVVEDTKGMRLKDYIIKRKLMLHLYDIRISEV